MNKIITNSVFVLIAVIVFVILGNMFFLLNTKQELDRVESELVSKRQEIENLKLSLENSGTENQKIDDNIVLSSGQEGQLMGLFINENLQKHFKVKSYELYNSYVYKPENTNDNDNMPSEVSMARTDNIPQLDENGMPVNAYHDTGSDEWEGLHILPIKLAFTATTQHFYTILGYFQQLPVNTIRSADIIMNSDIINGTLVFAFPLNDYK